MNAEDLKCCANCKHYDLVEESFGEHEWFCIVLNSIVKPHVLCDKWKQDDLNKDERMTFSKHYD